MPIPEFLLKSLYVKGSLSVAEEGFSFSLLDSFAPASLTSASISLGGAALPKEAVFFRAGDGEERPSASISPAAPLALAIGVPVLVRVAAPLSSPDLRLEADTVEAGRIGFSLRLEASKSEDAVDRPSPSRAPGEAPLVPDRSSGLRRRLALAYRARVAVRRSAPLCRIDPRIYGQFAEHLESCVYGGLFDEKGEPRADVEALLSSLRVPLMRWPGGNFASGYHWEDGIGPETLRPRRTDEAWHADEPNLVGTDEFLPYCERIGAAPYIGVNDATGGAEEAAAWVAYCNGPAEGPMGSRRAANGRRAPYGVRLWGLGNEVWGRWQIGHAGAGDYVARALPMIRAMRAADPDIEIVAVGDCGALGDAPSPDELADHPGEAWNRAVLEGLGAEIDYLSFHVYQPDRSGWLESYDPLELWKSVMAGPRSLEAAIDGLSAQVARYAPSGKRIKLALDEWNLWLPTPPGARSMHAARYLMRDALYAAGALASFQRKGETLALANLAQVCNVLPLIETSPRAVWPTALYWPFAMMGGMAGDCLRVEAEGPSFDARALGNIGAAKDLPWIEASASWNEEARELTITLANRHPFLPAATSLSLDGFDGLSPARMRLLACEDPLAYNEEAHPDRLRPIELPPPALSSGRVVLRLPPASLATILLVKA